LSRISSCGWASAASVVDRLHVGWLQHSRLSGEPCSSKVIESARCSSLGLMQVEPARQRRSRTRRKSAGRCHLPSNREHVGKKEYQPLPLGSLGLPLCLLDEGAFNGANQRVGAFGVGRVALGSQNSAISRHGSSSAQRRAVGCVCFQRRPFGRVVAIFENPIAIRYR